MASAVELREEAARLRNVLGKLTNHEERVAIQAMIDELESRAKEMDNGGAANDD